MKEKIKMILCLCLIIAGLPILMTLVFQGDEILLDTDSNEIQHKSSHPDEEEKVAALVSILALDIRLPMKKKRFVRRQLLCGPIMNMPCRREKHRRRD